MRHYNFLYFFRHTIARFFLYYIQIGNKKTGKGVFLKCQQSVLILFYYNSQFVVFHTKQCVAKNCMRGL